MKQRFSPQFFTAALALVTVAAFAPNALAFCVSNSSLSHNKIIATQLSKGQVETLAKYKQCLEHNGYRGTSKGGKKTNIENKCAVNHKMAQSFRNVLREIAGRGTFAKSVAPDKTECCSWKNKGCNPVGRKKSKVVFRVSSVTGESNLRGKKLFEDPDYFFEQIFTIGANDHLECRTFQTNNKGRGREHECRNYVFPETPFRAHEKTRRGMLIKSKHTGKCLEVGGWNKKNGANVNMWKCTGAKNQRWTIYRNGTIRSEMNRKCLDVAVGVKKPGRNGANVILYDCHGERNQRWMPGRDNQLISRAPGKHNWCLDVGGWNKKDGANANIWKCGKAQANQIWQIVKK